MRSSLQHSLRRYFGAFEFPIRLAIFWLLFFTVFRVWFILWFRDRWSQTEPGSVWGAFSHALPLDFSMIAYLMVLPVFFWIVGLLLPTRLRKYAQGATTGFNILLCALLILACGANVFLYKEWDTPLNNRALEYMATPAALLDSMSPLFLVVCVGLYLSFLMIWYWLYQRFVGRDLFKPVYTRWLALWFPVQLAVLFLGIRGGTGVMPINESAVYYSTNLFNNHAATNPVWHLLHSLLETRSTKNHFQTMETEDASGRTDWLLGDGVASQDMIFNFWGESDSIPPPQNVVFIVMESMTAQVIDELAGEKGLCPNLSKLIREGILFDHCYGSGYRTDQGLVSVLAGYPAQPDQSIVLLTEKAEKLPSITKELKGKGYESAFCYGGELTFANIGVWLRAQGFDHVISEADFPQEQVKQRWGVDDKLMLERFLSEINKMKSPFFATGMTLSLHPPFDVPYKSKWEGPSDHDKFLHSAAFADYAIGNFFEQAAKQTWFNNTLFVLVADHGNGLPGGVSMDDPRSRQVPLIFYSPKLGPDWRGRKIDILANHHDIPATVLSMLDIQTQEFKWSRDLWAFNGLINAYKTPTNDRLNFAYYTNENGLGWLSNKGAGFYQFESKQWRTWHGTPDSSDQLNGRAYLQTLYDDFLNR
jgi:phosphoglycerol transferase MdoB-like AlkP superfamily enzyme